MFLHNARVFRETFKRFFFGRFVPEKKFSEEEVTPEFLKVSGIFFDHPGQWFSVFDIMSKTQYDWAIVCSVLAQIAFRGWIDSWTFDIGRNEFTLAHPNDDTDENTENAGKDSREDPKQSERFTVK